MKKFDKVLGCVLVISTIYLLTWLFVEIWIDEPTKYKYISVFWKIKMPWYDKIVKIGETSVIFFVISLFSIIIRRTIQDNGEASIS